MHKKKDLILFKESALIACEGALSLLQRKLYNALLFYARQTYFYKDKNYWDANGYDGMDESNNFRNYAGLRENNFEINIKDLVELTGSREINEKDLEKNLDDLVGKKVEVNILKKDKNEEWIEETLFVLLPRITKIKRLWGKNKVLEKINYSIPDIIFDVISQSLQKNLWFGKIDMEVQKTFRSKYSITLYEFLSDYRSAMKVPALTIKQIRKLFGLAEKYRFNDIRKRCIEPAVNEINENKNIPFKINFKIKKEKKPLILIQFFTKNLEKMSQNLEKMSQNLEKMSQNLEKMS